MPSQDVLGPMGRPPRMLASLARPARLALALVCASACDASDAAEPVLVLCAASTAPTIEALADELEARTRTAVRVSSGGSNALARQVLAGAEADLLLSANRAWADAVARERAVLERDVILTNRLALIVPRANPAGVSALDDLAGERVRRIALAGESVPAGAYADAALAAAGLAGATRDKVVRGQSVRVALGFVARGEVDAGLVYRSDALLSDAVELVELVDASRHPPIEYHLLLLSPRPAARAVHAELLSAAAGERFRQRGFSVPGR